MSVTTITERRTASRVVHVPLQKLDQCSMCDCTTGLNLCSACGERIYCSTECQKADWKTHKPKCGKGKTQRLDIGSFWPFLAFLGEANRINGKRPKHPALCHQILNNPARPKVYFLPDGTSTNLVLLGDKLAGSDLVTPDGPSEKWWPSAADEFIKDKMVFRFLREGYVLPLCVSICFALLAEMYTTTFDPDYDPKNSGFDQPVNQRVRLEYERSPIADFGICKGSVEVKSSDTLGYLVPNSVTGNVDLIGGQDPRDHYWIYFTTLKGEDFLLDLCLFTFNFTMMVTKTDHYLPNRPGYPRGKMLDFGGYFESRVVRQSHPSIHREKQRFSVMKNKALHGIVRNLSWDWGKVEVEKRILIAFMEHVAGYKADEIEKELVVAFAVTSMNGIQDNLWHRDYLKYPKDPPITVAADTRREIFGGKVPEVNDGETYKYICKLNKRQRKGIITMEEYRRALWNCLKKPEEKTQWGKHRSRN